MEIINNAEACINGIYCASFCCFMRNVWIAGALKAIQDGPQYSYCSRVCVSELGLLSDLRNHPNQAILFSSNINVFVAIAFRH